jgi:hypothetical protein
MNNKEPVERKTTKRILCAGYYAFQRLYRRFRTTLNNSTERDPRIDELSHCSEALKELYWRLRTKVNTNFGEGDLKSKETVTQCCEQLEDLYWRLTAVLKTGTPKNRVVS